MAQLKYVAGKLAWRAAASIAIIPAFLYLGLDERIATGHVRGVWVTLLYELGPVGRWLIVASLVGILLYLCGRMLVILAGDQVALRATAGVAADKATQAVRGATDNERQRVIHYIQSGNQLMDCVKHLYMRRVHQM